MDKIKSFSEIQRQSKSTLHEKMKFSFNDFFNKCDQI